MALNRRGVHLPATQHDVHADTRRRVITAEQQLVKPDPVPRFCLTAGVNDSEGSGMTGARSSRWIPFAGVVALDMMIVTMVDPAGGDITVTPLNSTSSEGIESLTIVAGEITARKAYPGVKWSPSDDLTVEMSTGGSGFPARLLVELWFRGVGGGHLSFTYQGGG